MLVKIAFAYTLFTMQEQDGCTMKVESEKRTCTTNRASSSACSSGVIASRILFFSNRSSLYTIEEIVRRLDETRCVRYDIDLSVTSLLCIA